MTEEEEKRSYLYANDIELRELVFLMHERLKILEAPLIIANESVDKVRAEFVKKTVIEAVEQTTGVSFVTMRQRVRTKHIIRARQLVMYLLSKHKVFNLVEIGNLLGGLGHDTVIYSCKKVDDLLQVKDKDLYPFYVKANLLINGRINSYNQHGATILPGAKRA